MIHTVSLPNGTALPADLDAARNRVAIGFYEGCCSVNTTTLDAMKATIAFDAGFRVGADWGKAREIADTTTPTCHMRAIGHALGNDGLDLPGILEAINGLKLSIPIPIGACEMNRMLGLDEDASHDRRMGRLASTIEARAAAIRERDAAEEMLRRKDKERLALGAALQQAKTNEDAAGQQMNKLLGLSSGAPHSERMFAIRENGIYATVAEASREASRLLGLPENSSHDTRMARITGLLEQRNACIRERDHAEEAARSMEKKYQSIEIEASALRKALKEERANRDTLMTALGFGGHVNCGEGADKIATLRACHDKFSQWSREVGEMLGTRDCSVGGIKDAVRCYGVRAWHAGWKHFMRHGNETFMVETIQAEIAAENAEAKAHSGDF